MVVEHVFITTKKPEELFPQISGFLASLGFLPTPAAFQVGAKAWSGIQMRMSPVAAKRNRMKRITLDINAEYDRGRVVMAVSINYKRGSFAATRSDSPTSKLGIAMGTFATSLCQSVESLAAQDGTPQQAAWIYDGGKLLLDNYFRGVFRNNMIILFLAVVLLAMLVAFIIASSSH